MSSSPLPISALDRSHVDRAAPPGSMRYFALLYTPAEQRDAATALLLIDAEIRESAQSPNHDVAHTRLQWWRQEIDRLVNANAQHPATRVLSSLSIDRRQFLKLHELLAAADMDLARMTYVNERELRAYCARSGGVVTELLARVLATTGIDDETAKLANRLGSSVRATEIVRDVRQHAHDGQLYIPLEFLDANDIKQEDLRAENLSPPARRAIATLSTQVQAEFATTIASIPPDSRAYFRPLLVLAELHAALLARIAQLDYNVGAQRVELGPVRKPWLAWRAARRAK